MRTPLASSALVAVLLWAGTLPASAVTARRDAVRAGELTIRFSSPDDGSFSEGAAGRDAMLALGSLSAHRLEGRKRGVVVVRRIAVTLEGGAGVASVARLRCFLHADDGRIRVRVNGVLLSSIPQLVDSRARVGTATVHEIALEVPDSSSPGALLSSIGWLAETE